MAEKLSPKQIEDMQDPKMGGKKIYFKSRVSEDGYVYTPYITVRGRVIYHPTGGVFRFLPKE